MIGRAAVGRWCAAAVEIDDVKSQRSGRITAKDTQLSAASTMAT